MTKRIGLWLPLLTLFAACPVVLAQTKAPPAATDAQKKNIQEYIEPLRADVRQQKSQGEQVGVPSESLLEFRLADPATLPVAR